jgi:hypothetical protein
MNFNNNYFSRVSLTEIEVYHKRYYQREKIVICDDDYNIIYPEKISNQKRAEKSIDTKWFTIRIRNKNIRVGVQKYVSWKDYYYFFFLQQLLESYWEYSKRHLQGAYYHDSKAYYFRTEEFSILAFPTSFNADFSEEFFDEYKRHFIERILMGQGRKGIPINLVLLGQYASSEEVREYCQSIWIQEVRLFLSLTE